MIMVSSNNQLCHLTAPSGHLCIVRFELRMYHNEFGSFYSTVCHVCKRTHHEVSEMLKRCQGCKLISYCSKEHQQQHWRQHQSFCKCIQTLSKNLNVAYIFEDAFAIASSEEWCKFRVKIKRLCEIMLKRSLSLCESEMLYFPSGCLLCHKYDPKNLIVCGQCNCVNYCSAEHLNEDASNHSKSCNKLKIGFEFDKASFFGTLPAVNLDFGGRHYCLSTTNFKAQFLKFASESNKISHHLVKTIYFTILSCPLTFIHSVFLTGLHLSDKLVVHLVGSSNFEIEHLAMWEVVFHWLPNLKKLHLILIGPDVSTCSNLTLCSHCKQEGNQLSVELCQGQLYHHYVDSPEFTAPHMLVMFNCGLSEHIGGKGDTWQSSIPSILTSKCPVVLTSYTAREAENDISRLTECHSEMNVLVRCEKNPFSAKKPIRDWEQFTSHPTTFTSLVFYHNAFISVLTPNQV